MLKSSISLGNNNLVTTFLSKNEDFKQEDNIFETLLFGPLRKEAYSKKCMKKKFLYS